MKLNIGSAEYGLSGYVNIDNCSDWDGLERACLEASLEEGFEFIKMDGNDLSRFPDETFDEVYSNQCVGEYVRNVAGIVRVMKKGGTIELGVWLFAIQFVVTELLAAGVVIDSVQKFNGWGPDGPDDDCSTVGIKGHRVEDELELLY